MSTGSLTIDLDALVANWRALDAASADGVETGAVVRVPLFVQQDEVIKVDTRTGEYVSRA